MARKPNLVFMMTDDQRYDAFGFKSHGVVITPNLDKMADQGISFNNAYHVSPICMPSRASVHMGRYISDHQCGFDRPYNKTVTREEFNESYPVRLREDGYETCFIGKFGYAVTEEKTDNASFLSGQRIYPDALLRVHSKDELYESMPRDAFDVWYGATGQSKYRPGDDTSKLNGHENPWGAEHATEHNGYQAIDFIQKAVKTGKPFNLNISFKAPHNPLDPMQRHLDLYKDKTIPRYVNDTPYHHSLLPEVVRLKSRNPEYYFNTGEWADWASGTWEKHENYEKDIKRYFALITGVDEAVGRIRETLDDLGIADNTILIYTSDNGMFCGSKQLHGKSILYEESIKAPMIVYDPRLDVDRRGSTVEGLISHVDIAPTILDYCGLTKGASYRGESFRPLVDGETEKIHDHVYGENNYNNNYLSKDQVEDPSSYQSTRSKYVRSERYKLIRYYEMEPPLEEMFDVVDDRYEENNLVGLDSFKSIYRQLSERLDVFICM